MRAASELFNLLDQKRKVINLKLPRPLGAFKSTPRAKINKNSKPYCESLFISQIGWLFCLQNPRFKPRRQSWGCWGVFFVSLSLLKLVLTSASAAPAKMKLCGNFTKMRLAFSQRLITCPQNKSFELLKGEKRQQWTARDELRAIFKRKTGISSWCLSSVCIP